MKKNECLFLLEDIVTDKILQDTHDRFFMVLQKMVQKGDLRFNVIVPAPLHYQFYLYCSDDVFERILAHVVMTRLFFRYEQLM